DHDSAAERSVALIEVHDARSVRVREDDVRRVIAVQVRDRERTAVAVADGLCRRELSSSEVDVRLVRAAVREDEIGKARAVEVRSGDREAHACAEIRRGRNELYVSFVELVD